MKISIQSILVVLFVLAMSMPVWATGYTGNNLIEFCKKEELSMNFGICFGLMIGLDDGLYIGFGGVKPYCLPANASKGQMRKVLLKYLEEHPEKLHESYAHSIISAFTEAFPCKQK
jgi:hypothetical protein